MLLGASLPKRDNDSVCHRNHYAATCVLSGSLERRAHPPLHGNAGVEQLSLEKGGNEAASDSAKRCRNLRKKLTQIQQLRDKSRAEPSGS